ncbi:MAG: UPF0236 family protein [bacterium]
MNELLEMENRVLNEMRNVYRIKLQDRLQAALEKTQARSPDVAGLVRKRKAKLTLTTTLGSITLAAIEGYSPERKAWMVPIREAWGLAKHQRLTPALQRKIVCTAVETGSYEKAARLSGEWGVDTSDDAIRDCIMAVGNKALSNPLTTPCIDAAGPDDVLILMMDGWMARHRGEDWGSRLHAEGLERIHWHEIKSAILYRLSSHVQINPKRRVLISKHVVAVPAKTDPVDFGLRVQQEAMRMGMAKAKSVYVVMDGAIWLWSLFEDRFKLCATGTLDFYHASQHLHALADTLFLNDKPSASLWCHGILHALKHRSTRKLFRTLSELVAQPPNDDKTTIAAIKDARDYFDSHKDHMNYPAAAKLNLPIGSGSMESQCSQFQDRLKRRGQFWSNPGSAALIEVIQRHQNGEVASLLAA